MTRHDYAVSPGWRVLFQDLGLPVGVVLRQAGLPEDLFSRGPQRLSPEQYGALWLAMEHHSRRKELHVDLVKALSVEAFDPPLFAALCSPDLRVAATRIAAYKPLICPLIVRSEDRGARFDLTFHWPIGCEPPPTLALAELLFWVMLVRTATRTPVRPLAVRVPVDLPALPETQDFLGVPLTRGPWSVQFSELDARRPFLTANEAMWGFFEPELRRRLADLDGSATWQDRVHSALLERLPAGQGSMAEVARQLAVSPRTLQRRLADEGHSFQDVLARTREALARHYLRTSQLSPAEIAFLLGYDDPNSFSRAFHGWTGQSPLAARQS